MIRRLVRRRLLYVGDHIWVEAATLCVRHPTVSTVSSRIRASVVVLINPA
jgi:hypothetical protein